MSSVYTKIHKNEKALKSHVRKIKARGGKAVVTGNTVKYRFEKGGAINFQKKWKVVFITLQGKKGTKEIILGRQSNTFDVKQALARMYDLNIMEVISIQEIK